MKKTLVGSILGLTLAASTFGQSRILLETYLSSTVQPYPLITYGSPIGAPTGTAIAAGQGYSIGFYYSTTPATFNNPEPFNYGIPGGSFVLATGTGATTTFDPNYPGLFTSTSEFTIPGIVNTAYLIVIVYNGADYLTSTVRAHSPVFTLSPNTTPFGGAPGMGSQSAAGQMPAFAVYWLPEPSNFALAGLGLASLLIFRRRK